jgi:putative ABC transport system substrate-binding protein
MGQVSLRPAIGAWVVAASVFPGPAAWTAAAASPANGSPRVVALTSQEAEPYEAALAGFREALGRDPRRPRLEVIPLRGEAAAAEAAVNQARRAPASLIFALGTLAARAAVRQAPEVPIVAGMILSADDLKGTANATGVVLEFPAETELRWLRKLLPQQRNVAVLYNTEENQARLRGAGPAAKELGLALQPRRLESPRDLPDALESLASEADVLWGITDSMVLNPQTAQPILLFSLRNRIPFVGLSLTWVKAGALYALDRDYHDIGRQCGELALRVLQGEAPASIPPVPPRKVVYSVNLRTARHMKIDIPAALLKGAQAVVE